MIEVVKVLKRSMGEKCLYILFEGEKRAVAVDPSYNAQAMLNYLKEEETQLEAIFADTWPFRPYCRGRCAAGGHGRACIHS